MVEGALRLAERARRRGMPVRRVLGAAYNAAMEITLTELEDAINYWRALRPSRGEERALSREVNALATVYALMIFHHARAMPLAALDDAARQLIEAWRGRARTP
jgi:hypothetical protein